MRKRNILGLALVTSVILALTGCGEQFPELTEEQYNQTVEFAAGVLMKHSNNGQERLTYVSAEEINKQREKEAMLAAIEESRANQQQTQPAKPEPETEPEPEPYSEGTDTSTETDVTGQDQSENTGDEQGGEDNAGKDSSATGLSDAITLSSEDTQEISDNIFLSYQGYSVSSTYPESSRSYVVNADKGKKLLVLRFDLYNASDGTLSVNLSSHNLLFRIYLNGEDIGYSSVTVLPNDLTNYIGDIESRAHESVVVLTQLDEEDSTKIETISLQVTSDGQTQNVNLK
jgi:hypothetical protein